MARVWKIQKAVRRTVYWLSWTAPGSAEVALMSAENISVVVTNLRQCNAAPPMHMHLV